MIDIYAKELDGTWFGVAYTGERIVATALNSTRKGVLKQLQGSFPAKTRHQTVKRESDFARKTILMLKELHAGNEESKSFALATEYLSEPTAKVLETAATIPLGYVASYGDIARTADTGPRAVGQIMATNPLYPIVPCHRVVGADFSLVGYGGGKGPKALQAKLARLSKEARGFTHKKSVPVNGKNLTVYPVEHALKKAKKNRSGYPYEQRLLNDKEPSNVARALGIKA
jgi:O-6-methylguanine DNA methyltransferase